jgi:hypothetical protein
MVEIINRIERMMNKTQITTKFQDCLLTRSTQEYAHNANNPTAVMANTIKKNFVRRNS